MLAGVRFKLEGPDRREDAVFSPIDKAYKTEGNGDARLYIRFNPLITRDVVAQMWRQVDYYKLLDEPDYLSRWLYKRLSRSFKHAQKGNPQARYHLNLSTIIAEAGLSDYRKMSDAHRYVCRALDRLDAVVERYKATKKFEAGRTGGRVLVDVTYDLFPTLAFAQEQKRINQHTLTLQLKAESRQGDLFRG